MPYHTDLRRVFVALDGRQREFNWLLTDLELDHYPPGLPYLADPHQPRWMSGNALSAIIEAHDVQFIWGCSLASAPESPSTWRDSIRIRSPMAMGRCGGRVVCRSSIRGRTWRSSAWDSGATILLSRDDDLSQRFRRYFPEAVDLDEHNREHARGTDADFE